MDRRPPRAPAGLGPGDRAADGLPPSRRDVLRLGAVLAAGALTLRLPAPAGSQEAASPSADLCLLTPEQTEGPYYLPLELTREDITEGMPGLPLRLCISVADVNACASLADAAVDIWHCDAQGYYSGVSGNPGGNADPEAAAGAAAGTFLRGVQLTDQDGIAEFMTIYPGWYAGRTVHIHMKVHIGGTPNVLDEATPAGADAGGYEGGHVSHTGQLFFGDATSDEVYATNEAYAGRDNAQRLRNDQDNILGEYIDDPGFILSLSPLDERAPDQGFLGEITIGVDPTATPEPAGGPGGPAGPGGGPPGSPPPGSGPTPGGTPPAGSG